MKTGIFGGTFNPIHNGHLINARFIKEEFNLDEILFIPTGEPVHKKLHGNVSAEDRYDMVCVAIEKMDDFRVSRIELDREEASFTVITLDGLKKEYPGDEFFLIIGADSFNELDTWREYRAIINSVPLIVMKRPGDPKLNESLMSQVAELLVASNPDIEISSSLIRSRISNGLPVDGLIPEEVDEFIKNKRLYNS